MGYHNHPKPLAASHVGSCTALLKIPVASTCHPVVYLTPHIIINEYDEAQDLSGSRDNEQ